MQESVRSLLSSSASATLDSGLTSSVSSILTVSEHLDSVTNILRDLWAEILNEDPEDIQEDTSFFDLGGDSVLASELISLAKQKSLGLNIQDVFEYPALHEMATKSYPLVEQRERSLGVPAFSLLRHHNTEDDSIQTLRSKIAEKCAVHENQIEDIYPCSPLQEAMIAVSQGGRDSYMTQLVYSLDPELDLQRLRQAWDTTVQSNPVLRTRLIQEPPYGMLQCVIQMSVDWAEADSLEAYVLEDRKDSMLEADGLLRSALIHEASSSNQRYLVITVHHAILDATSLTYILDDLVNVYNGESDSLNRPMFNSFIQQIQQTDMGAADEFWSRQVKEASSSPFPVLPNKEFKPIASARFVRSFQFDWQNPFDLTKSLLIRAAWGILLSLRSHNSDVSFAATLSGRSAFEGIVRDVAGPLITAVPIRIDLDDDLTVAVFLQQIRQQAIDMMPFEQYGSLNVRRRHGDSGIRATDFQNLLLVQMDSEDVARETLARIGVSPVEGVGLPFEYDFALVNECTPAQDSYRVCLWYDPRILTEQSVEILASQLHAILDQLCHAAPQTPVHAIRCFNELDRAQIQSWNQSQPSAVRDTAHAMFERQAWLTPKALALRAWDGDMTFEELNSQSSRLAAHLVSLNVRPGVLVPLCFEKSRWMTISILAVLKAGGAWVPLDHKFPMDRLRQITRMANATLIVCSQSAAERMKNLSETVVVAETISEQPDVSMPSSRSSAATDSSSGPDDTAYVLFTSGSTGEPKGVVMSHGSLCTGIVEQGRALGCSSKWRSLQFSAHTFDPSISEGLMTLCHGGCVCVPSEEARLNDLPGVIRELDVNCAQLTPSVAHVISPEEVPSLKTLIFVGEAANSDNVARWAGKLQLINAYGPTETCIYCSVKDDFTTNTSPTSVGKACGGNNWIVEADNHEQLAAVGCVGEVVVSGPSLGKGYLDNEIATSAAFVTCSWLKGMQPFAASSNRLYRTGDLAFYNVDGSMQLVGRKDNQVKVRGNRVELGEVERRLNRLSSITTIMACVPKAGPLQRQLITVFSLSENDLSNRKEITLRLSDDFSSPGTKSFLKQLRERLSREVPGYMIPSYWVVVEEIPLNNSGKLDRKAVRQWIEAIDESQAALITQDILSESDTTDDIPEQHTDIYEILRKVWGEVLDFEVDRITPHTSFFTLNGNSLSAIKVVALSKKHGLNFTVQDLLLGRTLARLCEVVEVLDNSASSATEFSLAPSQEYLLSLYDDSTANIPEHRSSLLQTLVELPHTAIQRAFVKLIQVHPMLRARFLTVDGTWKYRLADSQGSYRLLFTQSRAINEEEQDAIVRTAHSSIDIKTGPIFSGDVFRTEAGSFMYIVAHRLAVDEHSWNAIRAHLQRFLITKEDISVGSTFQQWKQKISDFVPKLPAQLELQAERLEYWGLTPTERPLRQDTKHHFAMDISSLSPSSDALEYPLIQAMQDKVSAALLYSFHQVFVEYQTPLVHIEKDGRYLVQNSTEFLDTVGPFSIIHTVPTASMDSSQQQVSAEHILSTIKNSPQMFSNATGAHTKHPDIFIRYRPSRTGGQDDSFFYEIDNFAQNWMYSSGSGLVDIDIELSGSLLSFDLYFHSTIKAQDLIFNWASKTREILERAKDDRSLKCLDISAPVFPLLSLDSESMKKLTLEILPQLPGGTDNVEDIYPCSSMQLHILQYQSHNSRLFSLELTFEIGSNTASPIDPERLAEAWERIVNRHSILRTVFVQPGANNTPVQVVLRTIANTVSIRDPLDPVEESPSTIPHGRLPRLTIFALPSGAVSCELQISHALTDGWTNSLFQRELVQEYLNFDHHGPVTPYRSFIARSVATDKETDVAFWVERLKDCSPCSIKCLTPGPVFDPSSPASVCALDLPSTLLDDFSSFCNYNGVTTTTVIDLAWALTLEVLTNNSEVLYGHIVSGQARSLPELYTTAGPTLNMLATRINLSQNTLPEMAHALQAFKLEALNHDSCSPSELEQVLGTTHLYNTAVNISLDHQPLPDSELYLRHISLEDPWDLDIVLRAWTVKETIYFRVEYKPSEFSFHEIGRISDCFWAHLCLFARQQLNSQTFYQRIATRVALLAQGR